MNDNEFVNKSLDPDSIIENKSTTDLNNNLKEAENNDKYDKNDNDLEISNKFVENNDLEISNKFVEDNIDQYKELNVDK